MRRQQIEFGIQGDDLQYVEIKLRPQQSVIAEPGALVYKDIGIEIEALLGTANKGFVGKLFSVGKRVMTGECAFLTSFTNTFNELQSVAFSAPYPGKILPIDLSSLRGEAVFQKGAFLCAEAETEIGIFFQKRIMTALFGGGGFIMQRLSGDGIVFIHAGGMITEHDLGADSFLQTDARCLLGFESSVDFSLTETGGLKTQFFGGSGLFLANLRGPGKVWTQSLPFTRLASRFAMQTQDRRK